MSGFTNNNLLQGVNEILNTIQEINKPNGMEQQIHWYMVQSENKDRVTNKAAVVGNVSDFVSDMQTTLQNTITVDEATQVKNNLNLLKENIGKNYDCNK